MSVGVHRRQDSERLIGKVNYDKLIGDEPKKRKEELTSSNKLPRLMNSTHRDHKKRAECV